MKFIVAVLAGLFGATSALYSSHVTDNVLRFGVNYNFR
jgi:hypothetical protein